MKRWLAAASLLLVLQPAGEAQVFKAVAFGDSITQGVPFDDERPQTCDLLSEDYDQNYCGYSVRLSEESYYNCQIDTCYFDNRGKGGEQTSAGLTRIDSVLAATDWDLVMIMEGTNDLASGVSLETVQFNLEEMARKAAEKKAAVARASVIWYLPSVLGSDVAAINAAGDSLSLALAASTGAAGQCFVDVRSRLCPRGFQQADCLAAYYWKPPPGAIDPVGHVNSSGYDVMAEEFFSVLGEAGPPTAATPTAPVDEEVCSSSLAVSWEREEPANAPSCGNWYFLQIEGNGGTEYEEWIAASNACNGTTCSWTPSVSLTRGAYSFRLQARNTAGFGPFTGDVSFSVLRVAPEVVRNVVGPRGAVFSAGGSSRPFEWAAVKDARSYHLEVVSGKGRTVIDESIQAADACSETTCSFTPSAPLETDRYTWRVRAENACGGVFGSPVVFEVFGGAPALAPQPNAPIARVYDPSPSYRWQAVPGATEYDVQRASGAVTTVAASDVCIGGVCRLPAGGLAPGSYGWRVRGRNPLGTGEWSGLVSFTVVSCDCQRASTAGGASVLLAVPPAWNGGLVIWMPPSNSFGVRELRDLGPLADRQFDSGYALATTSYSVTGWPLFKAKRDLEKLYANFVSRFGAPTRVFFVGESVGAHVALAGLEKARIDNVVGALTMCGPTDFESTWEAALDLRLAYDAVCAEQPGTAIPGGAKGLLPEHGLEPLDVEAALSLCTGLSKKPGNRSRGQRARLAQLLGVTGLPEAGLVDAMELATFGLFDLVSDKRKLRNGVPVGNVGAVYPFPELQLEIARVSSERRARRKLERFSRLSGQIGDGRVLSLHTNLDPLFFVENEGALASLLPPENLTTAIAVESEPSHCGFSDVELVTGWLELVGWVDSGRQPTGRELERRCDRLRSTVGGECRFDARYEPGLMSARVAPRP